MGEGMPELSLTGDPDGIQSDRVAGTNILGQVPGSGAAKANPPDGAPWPAEKRVQGIGIGALSQPLNDPPHRCAIFGPLGSHGAAVGLIVKQDPFGEKV